MGLVRQILRDQERKILMNSLYQCETDRFLQVMHQNNDIKPKNLTMTTAHIISDRLTDIET